MKGDWAAEESAPAVRILGIRVHDVTTAETLELIEGYIATRQPHQLATVNPEFVMEAQHNRAFHVVLESTTLNLPDGVGLLWAARRLGHPLRERVTGSDTLPLLARRAAEKGYRLFFLGAAPGVAQRAAEVLAARHAGLRVAGVYGGSPDPAEEDEIVARIVVAAPEMLFVAYGAPRQDLWIHRNLDRLGVPVCMGVGGALDFIAGIAPRAPMWMRRLGLEWLYRLMRQPWRWRRMLALPRFAWAVLRAPARTEAPGKLPG